MPMGNRQFRFAWGENIAVASILAVLEIAVIGIFGVSAIFASDDLLGTPISDLAVLLHFLSYPSCFRGVKRDAVSRSRPEIFTKLAVLVVCFRFICVPVWRSNLRTTKPSPGFLFL
jgi:hypothetical protein